MAAASTADAWHAAAMAETSKQAQRVDLPGTFVLAVGTEIEVQYLREPPRFLGGYDGVMVTCLATGAVFAPMWAYSGGREQESSTGAPVGLELRDDLTVTRRFRGRVVFCRAVNILGSNMSYATTLLVEPSTPATGYR